jgi:hypothetical protein
VLADRADLDRGVVLHRGNAIFGGVRDAEAAADVHGLDGSQPGDGFHGAPKRIELQELGADVHVDPSQAQALGRSDAIHDDRRVGEREAELRVGLAGRDVVVGVAADVGRDADHHGLRPLRQVLQRRELVGVVDDDRPHACLDSLLQLARGLGVAVQDDPLRRDPGAHRDRKLAAGGDVRADALLSQDADDRGAGERLGREGEMDAGRLLGERLAEAARAGAQVVLGDHVGRRADLARELDEVAPAHLDAPGGVDGRAEGPDVGQALGGRHSAQRMPRRRLPAMHLWIENGSR